MADSSPNKQKKILVAFDFDHTIIDDNSDTHVSTLCPDGKIPDNIKDKFSDKGWTHYMGAIFEYLHSNGVTEEEMKKCMHDLPFTEGMKELLTYLDNDAFDVIVISDSNSMFIDYVLENAGLRHVFQTIYTNPAQFDEKGCLRIKFYHTQDWCLLSTENLCKGHILEQHVKDPDSETTTKYSHIVYVGDGNNDLCPALKLGEDDYICPRKHYSLWKKMKKLGHLDGEVSDLELKAKILEWSSGTEVLELVKSLQRKSMLQNRC